MSAERERYANRSALQCRPGVCVVSHLGVVCECVFRLCSQVSVCVCMYSYLSGFLWVDVCCVFSQVHVSVCEPFMVTDSIHLSRPFTVKRQLPVEKKSSLDSFSSSPTAAAVDSSAQESPPWSSHPFQPANRTPEPTLRASREVLQDLEVCRTKHLLWQRTRFSQPTYRPEEAGGLQQRGANLHPELWWLICLTINSSKRYFTDRARKCSIALGKLDLHNLKVRSLTSHHFQLLWFKYLRLVNSVSVCCVAEVMLSEGSCQQRLVLHLSSSGMSWFAPKHIFPLQKLLSGNSFSGWVEASAAKQQQPCSCSKVSVTSALTEISIGSHLSSEATAAHQESLSDDKICSIQIKDALCNTHPLVCESYQIIISGGGC